MKVTGNTPLMYAAMENKLSLMDRMVDLGCEVSAKNKVRARAHIPPNPTTNARGMRKRELGRNMRSAACTFFFGHVFGADLHARSGTRQRNFCAPGARSEVC